LNKSIGPISSKIAGFLQDFEEQPPYFAEYAVERWPWTRRQGSTPHLRI